MTASAGVGRLGRRWDRGESGGPGAADHNGIALYIVMIGLPVEYLFQGGLQRRIPELNGDRPCPFQVFRPIEKNKFRLLLNGVKYLKQRRFLSGKRDVAPP